MVSVEERMKVLNLLQTGAITPEQAAQLLQAMDSGRAAPAAPSEAPPASTSGAPASIPGADSTSGAPASIPGAAAWEDIQAPADFDAAEPAASAAPVSAAPPASAVSWPAASFPDAPAQTGVRARWLRVRVSDMKTGRPRVNVRLPLTLVGFGLKMGRHFAPEMEGMDMEELTRVLQTGEPGPFVDVYDEDDGEHVEVFLE
jgi:hypothetical protein